MRVATGRSMQLTKQVGEYRVAAELARRGLLVATFSGGVPHYDVIASGPVGGHVPVQVKANTGGAWQLDIRTFAHARMRKDGIRQKCGRAKAAPYPGIVYVFIRVAKPGTGDDEFFIVDWDNLSAKLTTKYRDHLAKKKGVRPKNHESFHTALKVADLEDFRGQWKTILDRISQPVKQQGAADCD